ncbi:MAG: FHA domain-containing protein [Sorangiineae bacterium]|nr:FHA domain-containing protein [Polyangiaceae bacterium]MEB2323891.1 FHA domain-containing protein [Sorangiineae bacterium]
MSEPPRPTPPVTPREDAVESHRWWLEHLGNRFELRASPLVVGRGANCQVVLDDALASRRHAEFVLEDGRAWLTDLESVNGVLVNGERVEGRRELAPGDRVVIGKQEFSVFRLKRPSLSVATTQRFTAETLHGIESPLAAGRAGALRDELAEPTGQSFELLGGLAEKVLALGRAEEAERLLTAPLAAVAKAAAEHRLEPGRAERAAGWALKLAVATGKGEWVDYLVEVYRALGRPLPAAVVDELYSALRRVSSVNLAGLRDYVASLQSIRGELGPADRFVLQRLEGLERLAAAR